MLKYALIFLVISLLSGAVGLTGVSTLARRIALVLFALFFLGFLLLVGLAMAVDEAVRVNAAVWPSPGSERPMPVAAPPHRPAAVVYAFT